MKEKSAMKKAFSVFFITAAIVFSPMGFSFAVSASGAVSKGNKYYNEEKFDEALKEYTKAQDKLPDSEIVNFDLGTALYKKGNYKESKEAFTKALTSDDVDLERKANYNIGNSIYKLAEPNEDKDMEGTVKLYREALDSYKKVMALDEKDEDAKFNHDFVEKKLNILLEKLKSEPPQEKGQQDTMDEGRRMRDDQERKEQQDTKDEERRTMDEGRGTKDEEKREEDKKQESSGESGGEPEERKGYQEEKENGKEMSGKEAKMLLEGYRQEEESQGGLHFIRRNKADYPDILKDW